MTNESQEGFHVPNSTIALMLVLTIVFMVWSFAVISTSLSTPNAAPVTGELGTEGPKSAFAGFWIGAQPTPDNPVRSAEATLQVMQAPAGEAEQ